MRSKPSRRLYSQKQVETKKSKGLFKVSLVVALFLAITVFLIWRIIFYIPKYEVVKEEWYYETLLSGRVFYETTPIISERKGYLHIDLPEGSIVKEAEVIAKIVDSSEEETLRNRIKDIQQEIGEFDFDDSEKDQESLVNIEAPIRELRDAVRTYGHFQSEMSASKILSAYNNIKALEDDYYGFINKVESEKERYENLVEELEKLEQEYKNCSITIAASNQGMLHYKYDNLDKLISYKDIESKYADLMVIDIEQSEIADGDFIEVGNQIGVISKIDKYYIALEIKEDMKLYLDLADNIDLSYNDESISYELITNDFNNKYILLTTTDKMDSFAKDIEINFNTEKLEGAYVPKESLLSEEDVFFAYVYAGKHPVKTPIKVLKDEGQRLFISGVKDGDKIVEDIEEFRR